MRCQHRLLTLLCGTLPCCACRGLRPSLNRGLGSICAQCFGSILFPDGNVPTWRDMGAQMRVSAVALPMYSLLPTLTEEACERGWTLAYARVSDVGVPAFLGLLALYLAFVEFGVYWMHRGLHDVPWAYRCARPAQAFRSPSFGSKFGGARAPKVPALSAVP